MTEKEKIIEELGKQIEIIKQDLKNKRLVLESLLRQLDDLKEDNEE